LKALVGNHGDVKEDGGFFILNYPEPDDLSHPSKSEWYRRGYLNAWAWALIAYARRQNGARQPWADTVLYDSFRRLDESEILRRVKVLKSQEVLDNGEMRFAAATKDDKEWLALMFALMSSVLKGFQITYHQDEVRLIYDDNPFLNGQQGLEYRKGSMDFISAYLKQALRIIEEKLQLSKAMIAAGFSTKSHRSIANDSAMSSYDKGRLLTGIALIFLSQLAEDGLPIQLLKGSSLHHYSLVMLLATVGATAGLVRIFNTLVPPDKATVSAHPKARPFGGIDLNAANLAMTIKRDGKGVPLPFAQQDMAQLNLIEGLEPEILSIKPASSLPNFADLFKD